MPLTLTLELSRAASAGSPFEFVFQPQSYILRGARGGVDDACFPWSEALLADLEAMRRCDREPSVPQRLGDVLRNFLAPTSWTVHEAEIREAVRGAQPVVVVIRSAAAELYALPWELLTVKATGQHLGELPGVLLRYEWPETRTVPRDRALPADAERLLFAWSGHVPASEHKEAIARACRTSACSFDERDVLSRASCRGLSERLRAATAEGRPFTILHLLCHGARMGHTFGLALDGDEPEVSTVGVDAGRLRQILAPHAATLRLVVLAACDGGNTGTLGNEMGSVAQALHRAGLAAVVGSRFPLSASGSCRLAAALYRSLLSNRSTLEHAFLEARADLAGDAGQLDWASLQLYARDSRDDAGPATAFAIEALRAPKVRESLSRFRALFTGTRARIARLARYKRLHDALQALETPFNAIACQVRRLVGTPEAWDEQRPVLDDLAMFLATAIQRMGEEGLADEFASSRRLLVDAAGWLDAASAQQPSKLDGAVRAIRRVLNLEISRANDRLLSTARDLDLGEVVSALRSVLGPLSGGPTSVGIGDSVGQLTASIDQLRSELDALVSEHDRWQAIDNDLRHLVDTSPAGLEEAQLVWPQVRANLVTVGGSSTAGWAPEIEAAVREVEAALAQGEIPRCVTSLRRLLRRTNHRFVEVDDQLLETCGRLEQVGGTLDAVLKVLDE